MRTNEFGQPIGPSMEGWTERSRPPRTPMVGRYCTLEPLDVGRHAGALFEAHRDAPDGRGWTYLFAPVPSDIVSFEAHLKRAAASLDPLHFAIVDSVTGTAVGTAALMRIDPAHGVLEVGSITYSPRLQRTRAGTEAMYLLMRRAFDELGYRRYEWKCDHLNAASIASAGRYGFQFEGIFRQAIVYKGRSRDTAWFSITDGEWPRVRAAFEAWLSEENFDATGKQRRSLAELRGPATSSSAS
jgi:RimJ/RimL family protein N-acetyltransferase